jgi:ubiquitin thioesterase OTU1
MRVRLKAPGGTATLTLADDANVGDLIDQITEKTSVSKFDIKYGYPPQTLLLKDSERSKLLTNLEVNLNGESLTISPKDVESSANADATSDKQSSQSAAPLRTTQKGAESAPSVSFAGMNSSDPRQKATKPVSLTKKAMAGEVPELPLPDRGATLGKAFEYLHRR